MGAKQAVDTVRRANLSEDEYTALRRALKVEEDSVQAVIELQTFLDCFSSSTRPLIQPLFFVFQGAGDSTTSCTQANWSRFVCGVSDFAQQSASWETLLSAWTRTKATDVDGLRTALELAAVLCWTCALGDRLDTSTEEPLSVAELLCGRVSGASTWEEIEGSLRSDLPCLPRSVTQRVYEVLLGGPVRISPVIESRAVDRNMVLLLRGMSDVLWEADEWQPLFRDWIDGRSFSELVKGVAHYSGTAVLVVRATTGEVLGAVSSSWEEGSGKYSGHSTTFLFSLQPSLSVHRATSRSSNYVYFNSRNKFAPRGLGYGGQLDFWRLWIGSDFEECLVTESDATFGSGALVPSGEFQTKLKIDTLEVWGCGGVEARTGQSEQRHRDEVARGNARKVDRAQMMENEFDNEMFFGKMMNHREVLREDIGLLKKEARSRDTT